MKFPLENIGYVWAVNFHIVEAILSVLCFFLVLVDQMKKKGMLKAGIRRTQ